MVGGWNRKKSSPLFSEGYAPAAGGEKRKRSAFCLPCYRAVTKSVEVIAMETIRPWIRGSLPRVPVLVPTSSVSGLHRAKQKRLFEEQA
jgi:hypothetical protein